MYVLLFLMISLPSSFITVIYFSHLQFGLCNILHMKSNNFHVTCISVKLHKAWHTFTLEIRDLVRKEWKAKIYFIPFDLYISANVICSLFSAFLLPSSLCHCVIYFSSKDFSFSGFTYSHPSQFGAYLMSFLLAFAFVPLFK